MDDCKSKEEQQSSMMLFRKVREAEIDKKWLNISKTRAIRDPIQEGQQKKYGVLRYSVVM